MKEILEKIGLSEIFGYICPGLVFLSSFTLWIRVKTWSFPWKQLQSQQVLSITVVLILSYILGLILASFNRRAHVLSCLANVPREEQKGFLKKQKGFLKKIRGNIARILYPSPLPAYTRLSVQWNIEISEDLNKLSHLAGLSDFVEPLNRFAIYRVFKAEQMSDALLKSKSVLEEADNLHRRFLFCMGMAMSIFLLATQSLVRLLFRGIGLFSNTIYEYYDKLPSAHFLFLFAITSFGLLASLELRRVAVKMWELEGYLTASLVHSDEEESIPDQSLS